MGVLRKGENMTKLIVSFALFVSVSAAMLGCSKKRQQSVSAPPKPTSSVSKITTKRFVWHGCTITAGMTKEEVVRQIEKGSVPKGWDPAWKLRPLSKDTYTKDEWRLILGGGGGAWPGATIVIVKFTNGKVTSISSYSAPIA